jgi:Flp pilus assembly protein TadD
VLHLLARARLGRGEAEAAEALFREAIPLQRESHAARIELAGLLADRGRLREAEDLCRAVLAQAPTHADAVLLLVRVLEAEHCTAEIVGTLIEFLTADPYHPDVLVQLGKVLLEGGRFSDAQRALARAVRFDPASGEALYFLGVVCRELRLPSDASRWWKCCVEASPGTEWAERAVKGLGEGNRPGWDFAAPEPSLLSAAAS